MVNLVIKDWISSQALMKSDVKNSHLLQLLIASWWFGVLMCLCKKNLKVMLPNIPNSQTCNKENPKNNTQKTIEKCVNIPVI